MAKFVDCSKCGRKFSGLDAYLWHFKVVGGCPPEPAHGTVAAFAVWACGPEKV